MKPPFMVRVAVGDDLEMLLGSWLKTAFNLSPHKDVEWELFNSAYRARVVHLLQVDQVFVACDPDEPNIVYGWVAFRSPSPGNITFDYTYVKADFRRFGICKQLLSSALKHVSESSPHEPISVTVTQKAKESVDQALYLSVRSLVGPTPPIQFNPYLHGTQR